VNDRERVVARVRAALAAIAVREPMPSYPDGTADTAVADDARDGGDRAASFARTLARAGGRAFEDPAALARWLTERGAVRGYCDPALDAELAPALSTGGLVLETKLVRSRVDDYRFGITRAAGAIAETGSIVLDDETTSSRLAALAPWIHVAVVRKSAIHASVADAVRALGDHANVVWCTGPSKTADVEGILIEGVHGPGEQVALVLPDR
jgi:L-lactate dehydrogenase complex protein LldG